MEFYEFQDGSIIAYEVQDDGNAYYEDYSIESIEVALERSPTGICCTKVVIKSSAPSGVNQEAEEELWDSLGNAELDEDGNFKYEAKRYIRELTGVDGDDIEMA